MVAEALRGRAEGGVVREPPAGRQLPERLEKGQPAAARSALFNQSIHNQPVLINVTQYDP